MKELKWYVEDSSGFVIEWHRTRREARESKQWYLDNIFQPWAMALKLPLHIVREEWELKGRRVVK
jgi:hypothetical protein